MGPKSERMDVESLQKGGARRGRWLDYCLVLSVIVLFAALAALAATGVLVVRDLQSKLQQQHTHPEFQASEVIGGAPDNTFKTQNFAYLDATSCELKNQTMPWAVVHIREGNSIGSNYAYNKDQHSLEVKQAGSYFLYVQFNVTCMHRCQPGLFRVQVADKLSCEVHLPNSTISQSVNRKCWAVSQLSKNSHLLTQMTIPNSPLQNWKLELSGSGFGMFLVG